MAIFGTPSGLSQQPRGHAGFEPVAASSPGPLLGTETEQPLSARVRCVREAYTQALLLAPAAIQRETGYRLQELLDGLLPGLLQVLIVLVASTMLGSAAGAALGALGGGVGALPGAAAGAQAGLDLGVALLAWLGLGTLALSIAQGIGPLSSRVVHALDLTWNAAGHSAELTRVHGAAQELAQAVAELLRLVLMAIVAYRPCSTLHMLQNSRPCSMASSSATWVCGLRIEPVGRHAALGGVAMAHAGRRAAQLPLAASPIRSTARRSAA